MTELEILQQLANLPINAILIGIVIVLWRKLIAVEKKYEKVLIQLASIQGEERLAAELKEDLQLIKEKLLSSKKI